MSPASLNTIDVDPSEASTAGVIDLQVNGYAGVDFNADQLQSGGLHHACKALACDGVSGILATVITDRIEVMADRLRRLVELREQDPIARQMILGLHVEGPFISPEPGYVGAHPQDAVMACDTDAMAMLLDAGGGLIKLVTLAPEQDPRTRLTRMLADRGVTVSAGHCNPSIPQLTACIDAGLSMFTHLGNGCPMEMHRHDNIIQRALSLREHLWLCFIADGVHVPFPALRNYLDLAGDRGIVVTDAMAAAGLGPGRHRLGRWQVEVGGDLAAWAPDRSHLVGSAMTMPQARENLQAHLRLNPSRIDDLTSNHPRQAIKLSN